MKTEQIEINERIETLEFMLESAVHTLFPNSKMYYDFSVDLSHQKFFELYVYSNISWATFQRLKRICNNRVIEIQNSLLEICDSYINN